jgi:hypothetical protein
MKSSKTPVNSEKSPKLREGSPELRISVYWGDVLYETAVCPPLQSISVGRSPKNRFILDLPSGGLGESFKLVEVLADRSANVFFADSLRGHLRFGKELVSLDSARDRKQVTQDGNGVYRANLGRGDKADVVIEHVSFYIDWVDEIGVLERDPVIDRGQRWVWFAGLALAFFLLAALWLMPPAEIEEKPPERLITLVPPKNAPAKAAVGAHVSGDGGAQKGDLGKADLKTEVKAPTAAEKLRQSNLAGALSGLTNVAQNAPAVKTADSAGIAAAVAQKGTGGFSTEGMKTGGGGKSVGVGRTVGQGEGGFEGTGRLGLSGDSTLEGGTGHGTGEALDRGGLDRDLIDAVIRRRQDRVRLCYERQLNFNPKLSGKVAVRFVIGADGGVVSSKILEDTMKNATVASCILGEVKNWTFPKPKGGANVSVDYPFVFESSAGK